MLRVGPPRRWPQFGRRWRSALVDGACGDEAEWVPPGVFDVEGTLAPGLDGDRAGGAAVDLLHGEAAERLGASKDGVEVADGEVEGLGERMRHPGRGNVDDLERHVAAVEVDPRSGLLSPDGA